MILCSDIHETSKIEIKNGGIQLSSATIRDTTFKESIKHSPIVTFMWSLLYIWKQTCIISKQYSCTQSTRSKYQLGVIRCTDECGIFINYTYFTLYTYSIHWIWQRKSLFIQSHLIIPQQFLLYHSLRRRLSILINKQYRTRLKT